MIKLFSRLATSAPVVKWLLIIATLLILSVAANVLQFNRYAELDRRTTEALAVANERETACANRLSATDNLISSLQTKNSEFFKTLEGNCRVQVEAAYDAGLSALPAADGVRKSNRERQAQGAFTGSVSGGSTDGSSTGTVGAGRG